MGYIDIDSNGIAQVSDAIDAVTSGSIGEGLAYAVGSLPARRTAGWRLARVRGASALWDLVPDVAEVVGADDRWRGSSWLATWYSSTSNPQGPTNRLDPDDARKLAVKAGPEAERALQVAMVAFPPPSGPTVSLDSATKPSDDAFAPKDGDGPIRTTFERPEGLGPTGAVNTTTTTDTSDDTGLGAYLGPGLVAGVAAATVVGALALSML